MRIRLTLTALLLASTTNIAWVEATPEKSTAQSPRKILYYRNPMGLPDTSLLPKKDSMGMAYLPVYERQGNASDAPSRAPKPNHPKPYTEKGGAAHTTP